jgi:hypothetical protein
VTNRALLVLHIRSTNRAFWRNPASAFFTLALPVMFLVLFSVLFGTKPTDVNGHRVSSATFTLAGSSRSPSSAPATPTWPSV